VNAVGRYRIRPSRDEDLPKLPVVERAAGEMYFAALGTPRPPLSPLRLSVLEPCHAFGTVWVAADQRDEPVGFLAATELDGAFYLIEMDVLPEHHRRGIGRALMEAAISHARWAFYPAVALMTDRHIPFNAPFYRRLGFVELRPDDLPPGLRHVCERETAAGFDPERRVAMAKRL
jgi:GNAT superfamily N-acetyltransferase